MVRFFMSNLVSARHTQVPNATITGPNPIHVFPRSFFSAVTTNQPGNHGTRGSPIHKPRTPNGKHTDQFS